MRSTSSWTLPADTGQVVERSCHSIGCFTLSEWPSETKFVTIRVRQVKEPLAPFGIARCCVWTVAGCMDLNDVEAIRFQALDGVDRIVVNDLTGTDLPLGGVVVDLGNTLGAGDGQVDTVTVNGAPGSETITIASSSGVVGVTGASAPVTVLQAEGIDQLVVNGNSGNDTINASGLAPGAIGLTVDSGAGDDVIIGSAGTSTFIGRDGNDTYAIESLSNLAVEDIAGGTDAAISYVNGYVLAVNVEKLFAGLTTGMTLTGYELGNTVIGNSGNDFLVGGAGADALTGGARDDSFVFQAGQPTQIQS
jgi:Ca2+-binding RTX toxin-like protein